MTLPDIFTKEQIAKSPKLEANCLETLWFENNNEKLIKHTLPKEANFSPVHAILAEDFDGDNQTDLLLAGNVEYTRIRTGKCDANFGCLLKGNGKGNFEYVPQLQSGLNIRGSVRSLQSLKNSRGEKRIVVGMNNSMPLVLRLAHQVKP
jgi:hypothetical protein